MTDPRQCKSREALIEAAAKALADDAFWEDRVPEVERVLEALVAFVARRLRDEVAASGPINPAIDRYAAIRVAQIVLGLRDD